MCESGVKHDAITLINLISKNAVISKMINYEFLNLILSALTAIGTCGATILALFFWFHDNKIKLNFRVLHGESAYTNPLIENGYFVLVVTNCSNRTATLETVGLKVFSKKISWKKIFSFLMFENTSHDSLPKKLEYGQSYRYVIPMSKMIDKFKRLENSEKIVDLEIFACVSSEKKDSKFKINKHLQKTMMCGL